MSAPSKPNKPKKSLDKAKHKGELGKKKKKGSGSNFQIMLAAGGVLTVLVIGIVLYFVWPSGNDPGTNANNANRNRPRPGANKDEPPVDNQPAPDLTSSLAKAGELADQLADDKTREDATKSLHQLLDTDVVRKGDGRLQILNIVRDKAASGTKHAEEFIVNLSKDNSNQSLALIARQIAEESFKGGQSSAASGEEPTNFLPARTDVVFFVKLKHFLDSDYSKGVFARGAFERADFDRRVGMNSGNIEQVVLGGQKDYGQAVGVIRTATPFNWDEVKTALGIEGNGTTLKGKTYYLGKIDFLTEFVGSRIPGLESLRTKAAIWKADPNTLIYGDETSIRDLIENPPSKHQAPQIASNQGGGGQGSGAATPQGSGGGGDGGSGFGVAPPIQDNGPGGPPTVGAAGQGGGGRPAPTPGGGQDVPEESLDKGGKFLTLDPSFRRLINFTEDAKNESLVFYADAATSKVTAPALYLFLLNRLPEAKAKEVNMIAVALPQPSGDPTLRVGLACKTRGQAASVNAEVEKLLARAARDELRDLFGFEFHTNQQQAEVASGQPQGPGGGFGPQDRVGAVGAGGGGGGFGAAPPVAPGQGGGGGGFGAAPPPGLGTTGGGGGLLRKGGGRGTPPTPPAGGGAPGGEQAKEDDGKAGGRLTVDRTNEYILITATVKNSLADFSEKRVAGWMTQIRGIKEMSSGRFRFGDLAAGLQYYNAEFTKQSKLPVFPYGAYPRASDAERGGRPYPATERVSFLRELLPYLGDDRYFTLKDAIDPEKSWKDTSGNPSNAALGKILIPHFLNPSAGGATDYVNVSGVDHSMAATHYVGMAGVGPDAAYYPKNDPRAGIMGYNRQTSPDDVKDGISNTIFMIEADKAVLGPWIAGGGATIRGTSDAGNDVGRKGGFSSPGYAGKQGVWVLMADGSARFLTKDISPEVFKALCTMAGSDSAGAIDLIAAKQNLPTTPRGGPTPASTTGAGKKKVEEEEAPTKK